MCDVMFIDGDCVVLSVRVLHYDKNFKEHALKFYNKEIDAIDTENNPLFRHKEDKWPIIEAMLGCDCLKNISNCGVSPYFKKFSHI